MNRRSFLLSAGAALAAPALARAAATPDVAGGPAFGSYWRAVVPDGTDPARLHAVVARVVDETDALFSPWRAASALARFNRASAGWHEAPAPLAALAGRALALREETGGAFDPSVGPLVARWGFGPIAGEAAGEVDARADMLGKSDPGATLDLCGIAKGYALRRIGDALASAGLASGLVELGGEVGAWGRHPAGRPWQIAIERPGPGPFAAEAVLAPGGLALATSGHWPNGDGARGLSHIIDPAAGRPADTALLSVSVLDADAARADALATALAALGPARGPAFARRTGVPALFLVEDGAGIGRVATGGIDAFLVA